MMALDPAYLPTDREGQVGFRDHEGVSSMRTAITGVIGLALVTGAMAVATGPMSAEQGEATPCASLLATHPVPAMRSFPPRAARRPHSPAR